MLVLTRYKESVMVGSPDRSGAMLKVTVLRCRDGTVRLGFECSRRVATHRLEVWDRIRACSHPDRFREHPLHKENLDDD